MEAPPGCAGPARPDRLSTNHLLVMPHRPGCHQSVVPPDQLAVLPVFSSAGPPGCEQCPSAMTMSFPVPDQSFPPHWLLPGMFPEPHRRQPPDLSQDAEPRTARAVHCRPHKAHSRLPACLTAVRSRRQMTPGERSKVVFQLSEPDAVAVAVRFLHRHVCAAGGNVSRNSDVLSQKGETASLIHVLATVENRSVLS